MDCNNNNRSQGAPPLAIGHRITSNEGSAPCQISACGDGRVELINRLPFPQFSLLSHSPTILSKIEETALFSQYLTAKYGRCKSLTVFILTFSSDVH